MDIINSVMNGCSCTAQQAKEYIDQEVANLRELAELGDLRFTDFMAACENLGIEADYEIYFIEQIAC